MRNSHPVNFYENFNDTISMRNSHPVQVEQYYPSFLFHSDCFLCIFFVMNFMKLYWINIPDGAVVITPEHFQWYAYRGRAMGYRTDLLYETFSNGKILLGSYMTKPLQMDNNAVYVSRKKRAFSFPVTYNFHKRITAYVKCQFPAARASQSCSAWQMAFNLTRHGPCVCYGRPLKSLCITAWGAICRCWNASIECLD